MGGDALTNRSQERRTPLDEESCGANSVMGDPLTGVNNFTGQATPRKARDAGAVLTEVGCAVKLRNSIERRTTTATQARKIGFAGRV